MWFQSSMRLQNSWSKANLNGISGAALAAAAAAGICFVSNNNDQSSTAHAAGKQPRSQTPDAAGATGQESINQSPEVFGVKQYPANLPIEDRFAVDRLSSVGGWWFAVLDGHGGWQCSDYSHRRLHRNLAVELANHLGVSHEENKIVASASADGNSSYEGNVDEALVRRALIRAFERTDRQYMTKVYGAFELGFGRDTRAGSCAIGSLVLDNTLYVANAGDSRCVVGVNRRVYDKRADGKAGADGDDEDEDGNASLSVLEALRRQSACDLGIDLADAAYRQSTGEDLAPEVQAALRERMLKRIYQDRRRSNEYGEEVAVKSVEKSNVASENGGNNSSTSNPLVKIGRILTGGQMPEQLMSSNGASVKKEVPSNGGKAAVVEGESKDSKPETGAVEPQDDPAANADYRAIDMSFDHNCREDRERTKLEREHPSEKDVVICRPNSPDTCYIKGKLQPTRALGDFYLKYSEFMRRPDDPSAAGRYIKPPYTPPYITATPEVYTRHLERGVDEFLIMGSDGLWDVMTSQEAVEMCGKVLRSPQGSPESAGEMLIEEALTRGAAQNGMTLAEFKRLPQGRARRRKHDDITVIVVDLKSLLDLHYWG